MRPQEIPGTVDQNAPLISVVMPAFNAERYVAEAINSVIAQTYTGWELIVVDDGSTDATASVVEQFCAADRRIRLIRQKNGKQGKARNTAIASAAGSAIAFLDADDIWLSHKLDAQIIALRGMAADVVFTGGFIFGDDNIDERLANFMIPQGRIEGAILFDLLILNNRIPNSSVLLRKELFERVGLFDERPAIQNCEDYDLWLRFAKSGAVFYAVEEPLIRYRRHASAATHERSKVLKPMLTVIKQHIDGSTLPACTARKRMRGLYRDLIAALIDEGKLAEATTEMKDLYKWDQSSLITRVQNSLLKLLPRQFNFISRECLYRLEWHLHSSLSRLKQT